MADSLKLELTIGGDAKQGKDAVQQVIAALKQLQKEQDKTNQSTGAGNDEELQRQRASAEEQTKLLKLHQAALQEDAARAKAIDAERSSTHLSALQENAARERKLEQDIQKVHTQALQEDVQRMQSAEQQKAAAALKASQQIAEQQNRVLKAHQSALQEDVQRSKKLEQERAAAAAAASAQQKAGLDAVARSATNALSNLVALVAVSLGVGKFLQLGKASLENAKALNEFSQETGISIETLSVLQFEARKMNLDVTNLRQGFNQLATSLKEVQQGNVATQQMFHSIGLDWRELVNIPLDQALFKVGTALAGFEAGANKTTVASALLGTRATKLIPLLQSLAGDGFAKATKEAERLGQVMREADVRAGEEFEATMVGLSGQVSTLSRSFLEGLIPGITGSVSAMDELTGSTQGAREVFGTFGEIAGGVLKGLIGAVNELVGDVNVLLFALQKDPKSTVKGFFQTLIGDFKGAAETAAGAAKDVQNFAAETANQSEALWTKLFGTPAQIEAAAQDARDAAITELNSTVAALKAAGGKVPAIDVSKLTTPQIEEQTRKLRTEQTKQLKLAAADQQQIIKAAGDARLAAVDRELARVREGTKQFIDQSTATFEQGRSTVQDFFAAREQVIRQQGDAELVAARARVSELAKALRAQEEIRADGPEAIQARTALRNAEADVQLTQVRTEGQLIALRQERQAKDVELANLRIEFEKTLAEAQGRTFQAALLGIDQQVVEFKKQLTQIGIIGQQQADALKQFRDEATGKAKLTELTTQAGRVSTAIAQNQQQLNQLVQLGVLSQDKALVKQNQFVASQTTAVSQLATQLTLLRNTVTDPATVAAIDAQLTALNDVAVAAQGAQSQIQLFQQGALTAAGSSFLGFLNDLASGTKTVGEAFGDMARSFVSAIANMINQILALEAITVVAKALGVPVPSGGFQFAEGGTVPGTGNADSVRAMLTPGEFVLNKDMVRNFGGLMTLERLRQGMRGGRPLNRSGVTYYATGGPVMPQVVGGASALADAASSAPTHVIIELSDGLVATQMETGAGQQATIRNLKNNRRAANAALGSKS